MVSEDSSGRKGPTVLRIKLRYDDIDTFVEKFAPNIGRAGLFIRSRTPKPVGSEVRPDADARAARCGKIARPHISVGWFAI